MLQHGSLRGSRRHFMNLSKFVTISIGIWLAITPRAQALDPTQDKILYMVATAHLDDQWCWTIQDTINSFVPATLHSNFALFAKYPHYTFSFEEILRYQLTKEYYPADYVTLSNYIAQGRWRVAGSAVVAGDVNILSPEALMRHILYANGFWRQEFGKTSTDIYLPDCFGFGYALPSVAAHCGLTGFSSQKLAWGSAIPIPFTNIGRWIGPDGASLIAVLQPGAYVSTISANLANDPDEVTRINNNFAQTGLFLDYRYFGTGDTGGGPTDASVNWLEQSVTTTNGAVNVLSAGTDQLYRDLTPAQVAMLPAYQGELLMQTHGTGCYTSHPEMKKYNRQNEQRADAAERASVIAAWLQGGGTYPQEKLTKAWERFLWHQFHDDLTGTSIPAAYTFSWNDELVALNEFGSEERHAVGILGEALDTSAAGVPVIVFNPLSVSREDIVEATVAFSNAAPAAVRVFDATGAEVPSQMGAPAGNLVPVTFLAAVPAAGAAVFDVRPSATPSGLDTGLSVSASQLENARYRVQLNDGGDIASVFDKLNNRELLSAPIRWAFFHDVSTNWPAWEVDYSTVTAAPTSYLGGTPLIQAVESGPARVSFGVTRVNAGSTFTERIRLAAGGAGDRLEWDVLANWATPQTLLKVMFPLSAVNSNATYDLGLGTIQRPNETSNLYEGPAQQWADLTGTNSAYGMTIMNDCKYGWDKPDNSTLRLTIFHTPAVGNSFGCAATNGFGSHRFTFALMGHTNDWRSAGSPWAAARVNQPLQAFQTVPHAGSLGKSFGFLSCNNSNVMVKAIKKAENSDEIIVRLQELIGSPQSAQLSSATAITGARQVTGAEDPLGTLSPAGGALTVSLGAYQPMTLALTIAPPASLVSKPVSLPITLPYNLDAISTDGNRTDGNFDSGYTYPAELLPATITRDGIAFQIGPTNEGALNVVSCQGQTIPLSPGYDRLYLLAAAASNDITGGFTIGGQTTNLTVRYFSGFIGQWNTAGLKKDELGWVCTHRHTPGGTNQAYDFCYLFKYRLDLPSNAASVTLPTSPNLRIFAMSLANHTTADTTVAGGALADNQLPVAQPGSDQTITAGTGGCATITFDSNASFDQDGTITSWSWSENGMVLGTNATASVALSVGTHQVLLTVTDNLGGLGQGIVTITVLPPLLVSIAAAPGVATNVPALIQFTGSASATNTGIVAFDTTDDHLGTITAQGDNPPNEVAANAFDNNTATKWLDFANSYPGTRSSWIQYEYLAGVQYVVTDYTLTSANDFPERDPANWRLQASNSVSGGWVTLDTRTNQVFSSRCFKQVYNTTNITAYSVYRLTIDSVANPNSANSVQLAELEFIGPPVFNYSWSFGDGAISTAQNPQHTYTNVGSYLVTLAVSCGIYSGSNSMVVTVGAPLTASITATPPNGLAPLPVQFSAVAAGGNGNRLLTDTTDDQRGTITAQGDNPPNEVAANAFDNTTTTKWLDFANAFPNTRSSWIQYQYADGQERVVSQYTVSSANDATIYPDRNPRDWRLLGSHGDGGSWATLDTRTNQVFTNNYQKLSYSFSNSNFYNIYRLQIDSVANPANATCMQLSELEFIGVPAYIYLWNFDDGSTSAAQNPGHTFISNGVFNVVLTVSDGVATTTNSLFVSTTTPSLGLVAANGALHLIWPSWAANYHLYSVTNLIPPISWLPVTNGITATNGVLTITVPTDSDSAFFQLRSP